MALPLRQPLLETTHEEKEEGIIIVHAPEKVTPTDAPAKAGIWRLMGEAREESCVSLLLLTPHPSPHNLTTSSDHMHTHIPYMHTHGTQVLVLATVCLIIGSLAFLVFPQVTGKLIDACLRVQEDHDVEAARKEIRGMYVRDLASVDLNPRDF